MCLNARCSVIVVPFAFILPPSYRNRWAGFKRIELDVRKENRAAKNERRRKGRQGCDRHYGFTFFRPFSFLSAIETSLFPVYCGGEEHVVACIHADAVRRVRILAFLRSSAELEKALALLPPCAVYFTRCGSCVRVCKKSRVSHGPAFRKLAAHLAFSLSTPSTDGRRIGCPE